MPLTPSNEIAKLSEKTFGVKMNSDSLNRLVVDALCESGYITKEKTTQGRGSKPYLVAPTEKLNSDVVMPLLDQFRGIIAPEVLKVISKPITKILSDVDSEDRYVKGLGLEALAFKLMQTMNIKYVDTRRRAQDTGSAEVDLIFESTQLSFLRWQVQCKNSEKVKTEHVAREVGLSLLLKSNVIVFISNGHITEDARNYATNTMIQSNLCIVMIDSADLKKIRDNCFYIREVFERELNYAKMLKKLEN